jgi:hypothetical protein
VLKRLWEHREPIGKVGVGGVYRTAEAAPKVVDSHWDSVHQGEEGLSFQNQEFHAYSALHKTLTLGLSLIFRFFNTYLLNRITVAPHGCLGLGLDSKSKGVRD